MKTKTHSNNDVAGFANESVEGFLSIAGIYLDSSERLVELTIAANRQALDDLVAQSKKRPDTGDQVMAAGQLDATKMQPMIERAISYTRNVMEVLVQAQTNAFKAMGQQLMSQGVNIPAFDQWSKMVNGAAESVLEVSERGGAAVESQVRNVTEAVNKVSKAA